MMIENTTKRLGSSAQPWIDSTVKPGDAQRYRGLRHPDHAAMVARTTGWIYYAASVNAGATVNVPLRLYRPKASESTVKAMPAEVREAVYEWDARPVKKRQADWLTRRGRLGPGMKAVQYAESADEIEEITDHPILDLLEYGNRFDDGGEVQELVEFLTEITGNGYANIVLDNKTGWPAALYPMLSQWTKIQPSDDGFVVGYFYGSTGANEEFFDREEVIHFKHRMSHLEPYYGISWTRMVAIEADTYAAARQDELARFDNEARPLGVFTTETNLTTDQRKVIEGSIRRHQGVGRNGQVLILGGEGAKFEPMQFTPKEMEYVQGLDNLRDTILMIAGVPKSMATSDDVNRANADAGQTQHARDAVLPRTQRRCKTLNSELLPLFGVQAGDMWLAPDNPVPEDELSKRERNVAYVGAGIITINEARTDEGLDPLEDDFGDVPRFNGIPLDEVGAQQPSIFGLSGVKAVSDGDGGADPKASPDQLRTIASLLQMVAEGQLTREGAARLIEDQTGYSLAEAMAMIPEPKPEPEPQIAPDEQGTNDTVEEADDEPDDGEKAHTHGDTDQITLWTKAELTPDDAVGTDADEKFQGALEGFFRKQTNAIAQAVRKGSFDEDGFSLNSVPVQKSIASKAGPGDPWSEALTDILRRHTEGVFRRGGDDGATALIDLFRSEGRDDESVGISFDVESPEVRAFLDEYTVRLSRVSVLVTATTEKRVSALIREGFARSLNVRQIADSIVQSGKEINEARATMIARSETARAYGEGRTAQWASTGQVSGKRWVLSPGACEFCRAIQRDNPVVPLDGAFAKMGETLGGVFGGRLSLNYADITSEPLHPGCKCTTVAVLRGIGETEVQS